MLAKLSSAKPGHKTPYFGGMYLAKEDREIAKGAEVFLTPSPPPEPLFCICRAPDFKRQKEKKRKNRKNERQNERGDLREVLFPLRVARQQLHWHMKVREG